MTGKIIKLRANDRFDPDTMLLVFTHIPKAGGTSFHAALKILTNDNYCHLVPGQNNPEDIDQLWGIGGHFDHESPSVTGSKKDRVYVSLLRHPIDRFLSFYRHVIARPGHHIAVENEAVLKMGPLDFAKTLTKMKNREISNLQCRMLTGDGTKLADKAIESVENHYSYCAPLASQQQIVDHIAVWFGSENVPVQRLNAAKAGIDVAINDALVEHIGLINSEDMKLFQYVEQRAQPVL